MAGLRDADAGARQVGFEDGRRGVSRSVGHRPGFQHQGSAATRKSRAVAAPRSARFPREQLSVQVEALVLYRVLGMFDICRILPNLTSVACSVKPGPLQNNGQKRRFRLRTKTLTGAKLLLPALTCLLVTFTAREGPVLGPYASVGSTPSSLRTSSKAAAMALSMS